MVQVTCHTEQRRIKFVEPGVLENKTDYNYVSTLLGAASSSSRVLGVALSLITVNPHASLLMDKVLHFHLLVPQKLKD